MGGELFRCIQCGKVMTIMERMLGPACGKCAKEKHKRTIGKGF